ncbi:MAG: hypothetical protein HFH35_13760 [Eubacterium sp.]|nr:hypothetical protein [Eubacterium sp.]
MGRQNLRKAALGFPIVKSVFIMQAPFLAKIGKAAEKADRLSIARKNYNRFEDDLQGLFAETKK